MAPFLVRIRMGLTWDLLGSHMGLTPHAFIPAAFSCILKVARTIAALDNSEEIRKERVVGA